jgi:hypothetical protein
MKNHEEQLAAIQEMRNMMDQATRFKSISGLSGMVAGLLTFLCLYVLYLVTGISPFQSEALVQLWQSPNQLLVVSGFICLFLTCLGLGIFMAWRNARQKGKHIWDPAARQLALSLAIPVLVGGIFSILLIRIGFVTFVAPVTLLFYGLGLWGASKFTLESVRTAGILFLVLGLGATYYWNYGLLIWALGFGLVHVIYGFIIYIKYERV